MAQNDSTLLQVTKLYKAYLSDEGFLARLGGGGKKIPAINGVTFDLREGEILGLIGESGCGKTTLGRVIAGYEKADSGSVIFMGKDFTKSTEPEIKKARRYLRYISDENLSGLTNEPKNRLDNVLYELVDRHPPADGRPGGREYAHKLLQQLGIDLEQLQRFPNEISGGQRQRYAIARAMATRPRLVVADEPVSNLDLNTRTEALNIMRRLAYENNTAFVFISHNPSMVRYFAEKGRTAIMFAGRLMEILPTRHLFDAPTHPYTRTLLDTNPAPSPLPGSALNPASDIALAHRYLESDSVNRGNLATLESEASELTLEGKINAAAQLAAANQAGCPFYRWCPERVDQCSKVTPGLTTVKFRRVLDGNGAMQRVAIPESEVNPDHRAACIHYNSGQE